jgi:hypothetical protein
MYPLFALSIDNPPDSPPAFRDYGEFRRNAAQDTRGILVKVRSDPQAALR